MPRKHYARALGLRDSGKGTDDLFLLMMVNMGLAMVGGGDGDRNTCIRRRRDGDLDVYIRLSVTMVEWLECWP